MQYPGSTYDDYWDSLYPGRACICVTDQGEGEVTSGSRVSVKTDRSERKSVLGALQDKKEQVRKADGGRQEQQRAQNRPRNKDEIGI